MRAYAMTDVGRQRTENQDSMMECQRRIGQLPNLFIVADGMGGHKAGDYASSYAVRRIREIAEASETGDAANFLNAAIAMVNGELYEKSIIDPDYSGMGTTVVACVLDGNLLTVANVGDSRLYRYNTRISQITRDHSLVEEMVKEGSIEKESEAYKAKKNIITRAVGVKSSVKIDVFQIELMEGDHLLLCSDGLSNMVSDDEVMEVLKKYDDLETQAKELVSTANRNGGYDNIAVVLVDPELKDR